MMNHKKAIFSLLCAVSLAGCQLPAMTGVGNPAQPGVQQNLSAFALKGKVEWPQEFSTQATIADVIGAATVSLIDGVSNTTIATGLTDAGGSFSINPSATFNPQEGEVFILEAVKGLNNNQPGASLARLRTLVRRTKDGYDDVDGRIGITISLKTTTLAYIQSVYNVPPTQIINGTDVDGSFKQLTLENYPGDVNPDTGTIEPKLLLVTTQEKFNTDVVTKALAANKDPMGAVYGQNSVQTLVNQNAFAANGLNNVVDGDGAQATFATITDLVRVDVGGKPKVYFYDATLRQIREVSFAGDDVNATTTTVKTVLNPLQRTGGDATSSIKWVDATTKVTIEKAVGYGSMGGLQGGGGFDVFPDGKMVIANRDNHTIRIAYPDTRTAGVLAGVPVVPSSNGYNLVTVAGQAGVAGSADGAGVITNDATGSYGTNDAGILPNVGVSPNFLGAYTASVATFRNPHSIVIERDNTGKPLPIATAKIFVSEPNNNTVRMLVPRQAGPNKESLYDYTDRGTGSLTGSRLPVYDVYTIAGDATKGDENPTVEQREFIYRNNNDAGLARFNRIQWLAYRTTSGAVADNAKMHELYFTESANHAVRVLKKKAGGANVTVKANWMVETVAGGRGGGPSAQPDYGVSPVDQRGNYTNSAALSAVGGSRLGRASTDPTGGDPNPGALLYLPVGLAVSGDKLYVSTAHARLYEVDLSKGALDADGVKVIQGAQESGAGFADGPALKGAKINVNAPLAIGATGAKWLFIGDRSNLRLRRMQLGQ